MVTGTVEYTAPVTGLRFAPIEVSNSHPAVENIVLETQDDKRLKITFHLTDVFALEDARTMAEGILPSIVNRLAFHRNVPVGKLYFTGATLPNDVSGSRYTVTKDVVLLWDSEAPILTLDEDTRQELAKLLEQPYTDHNVYSLYRFAIDQNDAVARFMFLYAILLQVKGDSQTNVESFIRQEMPEVEEREDPRPNKTGKETIFTCLRNEVAHVRRTPPERTRRAIQENLLAFQELVRTAILCVV